MMPLPQNVWSFPVGLVAGLVLVFFLSTTREEELLRQLCERISGKIVSFFRHYQPIESELGYRLIHEVVASWAEDRPLVAYLYEDGEKFSLQTDGKMLWYKRWEYGKTTEIEGQSYKVALISVSDWIRNADLHSHLHLDMLKSRIDYYCRAFPASYVRSVVRETAHFCYPNDAPDDCLYLPRLKATVHIDESPHRKNYVLLIPSCAGGGILLHIVGRSVMDCYKEYLRLETFIQKRRKYHDSLHSTVRASTLFMD